MSSPCLIVVGYNNTRIDDVAKLRDIGRDEHRATVVLITERPSPLDHAAADVVLRSSLGLVGAGEVRLVADAVEDLQLRPIGILPFSDRGVPLGGRLAHHYGLPGAEPAQTLTGLDKRHFRELEAATARHPSGYAATPSWPVRTLADFEVAVRRLGGTAFVKPAAEGNSRGCQVVSDVAKCGSIWRAMAPYHADGILVEALVRNAREFSWDFVAGSRWLTAKSTTQGSFRAEMQQIVPAPLSADTAALLHRAGEHGRQMVSIRNGAFHNELFLRAGVVSTVETNMRPGGMRIWDLAQLAFADFDPWRRWVQWSISGVTSSDQPVRRRFAGIRMLRAPADGILEDLPDIQAVAEELRIPVHRAAYTVAPPRTVSANVTNNAEFLGEIILTAEDSGTLIARLDRLAAAVEARITVRAHQAAAAGGATPCRVGIATAQAAR